VTTVLTSAADARYGYYLINLLGSVTAKSNLFDGVVVYDLGLNRIQARLLRAIRGVEVRAVPAFVPHWSQCWTWKPWIWTHTDADELLFLDAGITVLRSLDEPLRQIRERGYFVVSAGHPNREIIPSDYYELYQIPEQLPSQDCITSGIIGFRTDGPFFDTVVRPTFDDVVVGRNLGWSASEAEHRNFGINKLDPVIVRDCPTFRHEQTLLSIHFFKSVSNPWVNDVVKYGGWKSPHDHPEQLIWNHRRTGDFRDVGRVPFKTLAVPAGRAWALWFRCRWWLRMHSWAFRPSLYLRKAQRVLGTRSGS
jgi:hypothetical protein